MINACICTAFDTGFASLAELTLPVLVRYCAKHGYALRTEMNPSGDIYWHRTSAVMRALETFHLAVWMDTDALVTNHTKRIEEFIPETAEIALTRDRNGLNDGVLIARANGATPVLSSIRQLRGESDIYAPQDAIQRIYDSHEWMRGLISVSPNKLFNAFPAGSDGDTWEPGDFILQLPGINRERRIEIVRETIPQIVWD